MIGPVFLYYLHIYATCATLALEEEPIINQVFKSGPLKGLKGCGLLNHKIYFVHS